MTKSRLVAIGLSILFVVCLVPGLVYAAGDGDPAAQFTASSPTVQTQAAEPATYLAGIPQPQASDISIKADTNKINITIEGEMSRYYVGAAAKTVKEAPEPPAHCPATVGWTSIENLKPNTTYYVYVCYMSLKMTRPTAEYYGDWAEPITVKTLSDEPDLKANTMTVKANTVKFSASKVKTKARSVKAAKAFTVNNAQGKVTYKATANVTKNAMKKIKVASNGKVTVAKGTKKGTYKLKVKVTAAGNATYKSGSKTVKLTVKVS